VTAANNQQFSLDIRIYYEDTDVAGIVYHANFLRYFERARTEWLRALGVNQLDMLAEGKGFAIRHVDINYLLPAKFNDLITVHCQVSELRHASMKFNQQITNQAGKTICTAVFTIACVDLDKLKPVQFPPNVSEVFKVAH
jgi:acyl-CoA thioester hydrolase